MNGAMIWVEYRDSTEEGASACHEGTFSTPEELVEAIRKVAPKKFGDYAKTLPPLEKEPSLVNRRPPDRIDRSPLGTTQP